jgi:hypothetical protein
MDSSKVAFRKFGMWKNSRTVLNFTDRTGDGTVTSWTGRIMSVTPACAAVGFVNDATRNGDVFDLTGMVFTVEDRAVEALREEDGWLVRIEEVPVM